MSYLSSMIKFRLETERRAAIALEKAMHGLKDEISNTIDDIGSGAERLSWYGSCFFEDYQDVCSELKNEDKRFIKEILILFKREDAANDMIKMYIEAELDTLDPSAIRAVDIKLSKLLAGYSSGKLTKTAIASSIAILIVNSFNFKNTVLLKINKYSFAVLTAAALYGKVQVAAMAARRLRDLSPSLYQLFYINNMEMLYFLISDSVDQALINSIGLRGEDRFISIVKDLTR